MVQATLGEVVGKGAKDVNKFALVVSTTTSIERLPSRVFMLLRSMLVMSRIALMSLANVNLPQPLRFFSLMPESHATSCGVISPVGWDVRLDA